MKIAVCLSGQPRVLDFAAPNILSYFSGEDHVYDFFCHSWDYNTYKRKKLNPLPGEHPVYWSDDQPVAHMALSNKIKLYHPKNFKIESATVFKSRFPWDSLSYSMMMANYLKRQYEVDNNFRYDLVIRSRYDIIFNLAQKFIPNSRATKDNYLDVFCSHEARMAFEYNRVNVSDEFFYGSSTAMDMMCDLFRYLSRKEKCKQLDDYECLGPGVAMSDLAESKNLRLRVAGNIAATVFRPEMTHMNPLTDFDQICDYSMSFYRNY
jgi:hypothetical protein